MHSSNTSDLPHALVDGDELAGRLADRRLAVFLDYDGTLTPIVDRPEDAVCSESMRNTVRGLASRCTVCVVSGRDRLVVQRLMGVDDLVVVGRRLRHLEPRSRRGRMGRGRGLSGSHR